MLSSNHSLQDCELLERAKAAYKSADYNLAESTFSAIISRHSSHKSLASKDINFVILLLDYRAACRYHLHVAHILPIRSHDNIPNVKGSKKRQRQMDWLSLAIQDAKDMIQLRPSACRGYLRLAKLLSDGESKFIDALDVIEEGISNYSKLDCKLGKLLYEMRDKINEQFANSVHNGKDVLFSKEIKQILFGQSLRVLHLSDIDLGGKASKHVRFNNLTGLKLERCKVTHEFWESVNKNLYSLHLKAITLLPNNFTRLYTLIVEDCEDRLEVDTLISANLETLYNLRSPFPYTGNKRLLTLSAPQSFNAFRVNLNNETNLIIDDSMLYALHLNQCTVRFIVTPNLLHLTLSSTPPSLSVLHSSLRSLHLINVPLTEDFLDAVLRLSKLERLVIFKCTMQVRTRHMLFTFLSNFLPRNASSISNNETVQQKRFLFLVGEFTNITDTVAFRSFYTDNYLGIHSTNKGTAINTEAIKLKMEIGKRAEMMARRIEMWYWQDICI